ncbi:MAG TPA: hypothetical protein P5106_08995 [Caldisericia bacterium]|nr:hypothetical protein [Caldisericia bacterium]
MIVGNQPFTNEILSGGGLTADNHGCLNANDEVIIEDLMIGNQCGESVNVIFAPNEDLPICSFSDGNGNSVSDLISVNPESIPFDVHFQMPAECPEDGDVVIFTITQVDDCGQPIPDCEVIEVSVRCCCEWKIGCISAYATMYDYYGFREDCTGQLYQFVQDDYENLPDTTGMYGNIGEWIIENDVTCNGMPCACIEVCIDDDGNLDAWKPIPQDSPLCCCDFVPINPQPSDCCPDENWTLERPVAELINGENLDVTNQGNENIFEHEVDEATVCV